MRKSGFYFISLLLALWPSLVAAEIYQWTDPRGVIHFADNLLSVPEAVRESESLIVRKDLPAKRPLAQDSTPYEPEATASLPHNSHGQGLSESDFPVSSTPSVVYYSPQEPQIVVINSATRAHHPRHCLAPRDCNPVFRPNFNDRSFIHPSVFNEPRHFTHRRVSKPGRK